MTEEQKQALKAVMNTSEQVNQDLKLAAEDVGGETFQNSGYTEQFLNTTFDQFNMYAPLTLDFMKSPVELMTAPTVSMDYYLLTSMTDANLAPGECPDTIGTATRKVSWGFGKLWLKDELLKEDLIARVNQVNQLGKTFMSDGSSANPINASRKKLLSQLTRNFESKAWNGTVDSKGYGIVGLKTQHTTLNTTTTTNSGADNTTTTGNSDGRYNKVNYTDNVAGRTAFCADIYGRVQALFQQYGANHFTIYVPTGAGATIRAAFADYEKVSQVVQQLLVNTNGSNEQGTKTGIFANLDGRSFVNERMDIKEISGLADGEVYLYPDTVFGEWTFKYLEYGIGGQPAPGIQTYVSGLNNQMRNITGLSSEAVNEMCCNDSRCDIFTLSLQWTGQIIANAVGMSTHYSRVNFVKAFSIVDVSDKITGQVNMSAV